MRKLKGRLPCLLCHWQAQEFLIIFRFLCVTFGWTDLTLRVMYTVKVQLGRVSSNLISTFYDIVSGGGEK